MSTEETHYEQDLLEDLAGPSTGELRECEYEEQSPLPDGEIMTPYFHKLMHHEIYSPEKEKQAFIDFESAKKSWAENMMRIGLAAIRVAQNGFDASNSKTPWTMLRRSFNQDPTHIMQSIPSAIPEVYELVYANRALLASANTYDSSCIKRVEKNSAEHAAVLLPWKASTQTLEHRIQGDEYYPGLMAYASKIQEWRRALAARTLSKEAHAQLYHAIASELGLPPEGFLELLKDTLNHREQCYKVREDIIAHNQRLVLHFAKKELWNLGKTYLAIDDLVSVGNDGLTRGIELFEIKRCYKFSTYGYWWIMQAIKRGVKNATSGVRVPIHIQERIGGIRKAIRELQEEHDDETYTPSIEEISSMTGLDERKIQQALDAGRERVSLDAAPSTHGRNAYQGSLSGDNFYEVRADEKQENPSELAHNALLKDPIEQVLSTLTERERRVLRMRFGFENGTAYTLEEVGKVFELTRERIRQIESKALRKLRHPRKLKMLSIRREEM